MGVEGLRVAPEQLRHRLEPAGLGFRTTAEVEPLEGTLGQPRALHAIEFGLKALSPGYNLFVAGAPGMGRTSTIRDHLDRHALEMPRPDDWLYVHNFEHVDRPIALRLPAGRGREFAEAMERFVEQARRQIAHAFETERYEQRRRELLSDLGGQRETVLEGLQAFARERGFAVAPMPTGLVSVPVVDGQPITPEQLEKLSAEDKQALESKGEEVQARAGIELRRIQHLERDAEERLQKLQREVALFAVDPLLHALRDAYQDQPPVLAYLSQVREDVPNHLADFRPGEPEPAPGLPPGLRNGSRDERFARYRVNVLVDNAGAKGAPVVFETNPTYYNLLGRVEYRSSFGTAYTDFHQVKPGALHRANGGYLVLEALGVLSNAFAWDALKRALISGEVKIENLGEQYSPVPTASLAPQPVPLAVKVVLVGSPLLYHLLLDVDEDFRQLFKVKVDFAPDMEWTEDHVGAFAAFISRKVRDAGLKHFDAAAVARVVEHSSRLSEHQQRLSTRLLEISDLVTESVFWAGEAGHETVRAEDVDRALEEKEQRSNLVQEHVQREIGEGTLRIEVDGARVGQVNGLSVIDLRDYRFGMPSRVTAVASLGRGSVESIERTIELSGPIHSKGFLILSGYLAQRYAQEYPLALRATLTFEQSYDEVEGDSASSAELYALLSAISGLPLEQGVAATGSIDQHGAVQAVGGINEKIEGFYRVCKQSGLTGHQGVIIPKANLPHLMLSAEVVEAVAGGQFSVWAVSTVDEGLELLTGRPGAVVHNLVDGRLRDYAGRLQTFAASPNGHEPAAQRTRRVAK